MGGHDQEIERLREGVDCGAVLERATPPWALDRRESTRGCRKYRRGRGEVIIVNHGGRGWWDACGAARGDVFALVQHLEPGLTFGHVRRALRPLAGVAPVGRPYERKRDAPERPLVSAAVLWAAAAVPRPGSRTWRYLTGARRLPAAVVADAVAAGGLREGRYGNPWFAHRRGVGGEVVGFEVRGPRYRGFAAGGEKALFLHAAPPDRRRAVAVAAVAVCEGAIDALSLAALEGTRPDTLYAATTGGMGLGTTAALATLLLRLRDGGVAPVLRVGTDNDGPGERLAARLVAFAGTEGGLWRREVPPAGFKDWNDALRAGGAGRWRSG